MNEALRREDALTARLRGHRAKIARAEAILTEALTQTDAWYVAFSGGKDSLVALDLMRRQCPRAPAIWSDDELEYPEQPASVPAACAALGVDLVIVSGFARHAGWFDPWRTRPWWREPAPAMIWTGSLMEPWSLAAGYRGAVVGLRKDEARHRRIALSRFGALHQVADGQWRANPLAGWSAADVWAYIADRGLPYSPVYDVLARLGVPRERQRVGPLPLSEGWMLRAGWPALYERLVARYGRQWGFG